MFEGHFKLRMLAVVAIKQKIMSHLFYYMCRASFFILYFNQQMHNYIVKVYITIVSLCSLYCYMF